MEKIFIDYEIQQGCFIIKVLSYSKDIEYQEKVYSKDFYKNDNTCLYNDVLDDFNLDYKFENEKFYDMLDLMCDNIIKEIKGEK